MDFAVRIRELAARIPNQIAHIRTEEATKNALVMPFIAALGYDPFNPLEVTPELDADFGTKKGEKVDYGILIASQLVMLFECKGCNANLDEVHASQLFRYFTVTTARIGILTNGIKYRFFTDLDAPNKMDSKPFLEIDLLNLDDVAINELKKFAKSNFELDGLISNATDLKYTGEIKKIFAQELQSPSETFVRFFTGQVYSGRMTEKVKEQFTEITKRALQQFVSDRISDRLKSALATEQASTRPDVPKAEPEPELEVKDIVTTEDELRAYILVQAIVSSTVEPERLAMRDQKSYCSVLLDDNNRKPVCRFWFNSSQKYLGLIDAEKKEQRVPIKELHEISKHAEALKAAVQMYLDK